MASRRSHKLSLLSGGGSLLDVMGRAGAEGVSAAVCFVSAVNDASASPGEAMLLMSSSAVDSDSSNVFLFQKVRALHLPIQHHQLTGFME
jgi:hypothetical protein